MSPMPVQPGRTVRVNPVGPAPLTGIARCRELAQKALARIDALEPFLDPKVGDESECWSRAAAINASVSTTASLFVNIRDAANAVAEGPDAERAKEIAKLCTRGEKNDAHLAESLPEAKAQRYIFHYVDLVMSRRHNAAIFMKDILARCDA